MYQNWDKAKEIINDGTLEIWIRRGLELSYLADAISSAIKSVGAMPGTKNDADDIITARVLMLLDPRMPISDQIAEGPAVHGIGTEAERKVRALEMMGAVGLSERLADRYPHELSGEIGRAHV